MSYKLVLLFSLLSLLASCSKMFKELPRVNSAERKLLEQANENFEALPYSIINKYKQSDKIALGEKLYFEKKLSINNTISCNSCHNLETFGVDNEPTSPGHNGVRGGRNSPTVLNAAIHISQFWDGRAEDVEAQALGPILNPIEHGLASETEALNKIDTKEYRQLFERAFPNQEKSFTYKNIGQAIGAFERTLLTQSRFDDYLRGSMSALNYNEKIGLKRFMEKGCISCHSGAGIGGDGYMKLGLEKEYPTQDRGRIDITGEEEDLKVFKIPSLRNIVHTGPYLHDGSIRKLDQMIKVMGEYQLGEILTNQDVFYIKAFLGALSAKEKPYKASSHH